MTKHHRFVRRLPVAAVAVLGIFAACGVAHSSTITLDFDDSAVNGDTVPGLFSTFVSGTGPFTVTVPVTSAQSGGLGDFSFDLTLSGTRGGNGTEGIDFAGSFRPRFNYSDTNDTQTLLAEISNVTAGVMFDAFVGVNRYDNSGTGGWDVNGESLLDQVVVTPGVEFAITPASTLNITALAAPGSDPPSSGNSRLQGVTLEFSAAVPEPHSMMLSVLFGSVVVWTRGRRSAGARRVAS